MLSFLWLNHRRFVFLSQDVKKQKNARSLFETHLENMVYIYHHGKNIKKTQ